jgi:putative transposase
VSYSSDLTDAEWDVIAPLLPQAKTGGRPRTTSLRQILDAVNYVSRSGCAWRMLPKDFPPYQTVYDYFRNWRNDGTWERVHDLLRERVREGEGRETSPSAAIIDSQSAKTTEKGGPGAMTQGRRSKAGSGISSLTHSG